MTTVRLLAARDVAAGLGEWRQGGVAYAQLARRLGRIIADGRIAASVRLPAERELASESG